MFTGLKTSAQRGKVRAGSDKFQQRNHRGVFAKSCDLWLRAGQEGCELRKGGKAAESTGCSGKGKRSVQPVRGGPEDAGGWEKERDSGIPCGVSSSPPVSVPHAPSKAF